jgi:hypothetical protein
MSGVAKEGFSPVLGRIIVLSKKAEALSGDKATKVRPPDSPRIRLTSVSVIS